MAETCEGTGDLVDRLEVGAVRKRCCVVVGVGVGVGGEMAL